MLLSMQDELIPINVWLSGRSYRIRIRQEDEAAVRSAVKAADTKVTELRQHFSGKDDQDFIAMCLLMYATDGAVSGNDATVKHALSAMASRIDKLLDKG